MSDRFRVSYPAGPGQPKFTDWGVHISTSALIERANMLDASVTATAHVVAKNVKNRLHDNDIHVIAAFASGIEDGVWAYGNEEQATAKWRAVAASYYGKDVVARLSNDELFEMLHDNTIGKDVYHFVLQMEVEHA